MAPSVSHEAYANKVWVVNTLVLCIIHVANASVASTCPFKNGGDQCPTIVRNEGNWWSELCCPNKTTNLHCWTDPVAHLRVFCLKTISCPPGELAAVKADDATALFCVTCPQGSFSSVITLSSKTIGTSCQQHYKCTGVGQTVLWVGNATHDTLCGCRAGYQISGCSRADFRQNDPCRCDLAPAANLIETTSTIASLQNTTSPGTLNTTSHGTLNTTSLDTPDSDGQKWIITVVAVSIVMSLVITLVIYIIWRRRKQRSPSITLCSGTFCLPRQNSTNCPDLPANGHTTVAMLENTEEEDNG